PAHQADPRRDDELGGECLGVVEEPERLDRRRRQPDFLLRLAQRRGEVVGVAGVDATAGERDLAGVVADAVGPLGEHEMRLAAIDDRHQDGGAHERAGRHHAPREPAQSRAGDGDELLDADAAHTNRTETEPRRVYVARTVSPALGRSSFDTDPVMTMSPARSPSPRAPRWLATQASELSGLPMTSAAVFVAAIAPLCSYTSPSRARSRPVIGVSAPPSTMATAYTPSAMTSVPTASPL